MKKKECPSCAMQIDVNAKVCPVCAYEFPVQSKWNMAVAIILVIALILWIIL